MAGSYNLGTAEGLIRIKYDGTGAQKAQEDFKKTEAAAGKSGATLGQVGRGSALAAGVLAGGLAYATTKAVDFEKQISAIGAVSGATQPQMEALRRKALQLGADTSFSASGAANAMEELAKAGVSLPDILNGAADATVALAAAGGIQLPEAATQASNAMNQFNLSAGDLKDVVNIIAGAANASAIDVGEFGQSMQQVGAVANLAGISFRDTSVAIALLGQAGIKGSDAGTSLKTFLQNLIPQTKEQTALMQQLGLVTKQGGNAFFDASGHAKSLADISGILAKSMQGQTEQQKLATLQTLFGSDAIRAAAVLANNGADGFNNMANAMSKTSAADVAAARLNNTAGKLEQLKGSAETAAISFGTALLPGLVSVAKAFTSFANFLGSLGPGTVTIIVKIVSALIGLLVVTSIVSKIIVAIKLFQGAWIALNASFIATPIGAIITLIVLLVAVFVILWLKCAGFRNFFIGAWNGIWSVLKAIGSWFAGPFANFFIGAWAVIMAVFNAVKGPIMAVFNFIKNGIVGAFNVVNGIMTFFAPLFQSVFGLIVSIIKTAWSIIAAIFQVAWAIIGPIVQIGILFITGAIQAAMWVITGIWNALWNGIKMTILAVWGFIGPYVMGAITVITTIIQAAMAIISGIWNAVWPVIQAVVKGVWDTIVGVIRGAITIIIGAIDGIKAIVDKVRGFFNQLRDAAKGGVDGLIGFVAGIGGRIIGAIGDAGRMLWDVGKNIIEGLVNGIKSAVGSAVQAAKDAVKGAIDGAKSMLGIKSPSKVFMKIGVNTIEGLAEGILDAGAQPVRALEVVLRRTNAVQLATSPLAVGGILGASTPGVIPPALGGSGTTVNFGDINVNVPAAVADPSQIAQFTARRIVTTLATSSAQP